MNQVINTNSFPELGNRAHTSFSTWETSSLSGLSNLFGKDWVQKIRILAVEVLILYTLTSVCIVSVLLSIHSLRC